jgi:hypothetical protein
MTVQLHRRWWTLDIMEPELLLFGLDCMYTYDYNAISSHASIA